jgi:hypothetical protein
LQGLHSPVHHGGLGHHLAAERLGQQGRRQPLDDPAGGGEPGFELVSEGEEGLGAADDFLLFREGRET